jgi:hypothetical protein
MTELKYRALRIRTPVIPALNIVRPTAAFKIIPFPFPWLVAHA